MIKCPFVEAVSDSDIDIDQNLNLSQSEDCLLRTRVDWCCLLLKYVTMSSPQFDITMICNIHSWVLKCRQQQPQYWVSAAGPADMESYYQLLTSLMETNLLLKSTNLQSSKDIQLQVAKQLSQVTREACQCCGGSSWAAKLHEYERMQGHFQQANHLQWQKR